MDLCEITMFSFYSGGQSCLFRASNEKEEFESVAKYVAIWKSNGCFVTNTISINKSTW